MPMASPSERRELDVMDVVGADAVTGRREPAHFAPRDRAIRDRAQGQVELGDHPALPQHRQHRGGPIVRPVVEREHDRPRRQRRTMIPMRGEIAGKDRRVPVLHEPVELRRERRRKDVVRKECDVAWPVSSERSLPVGPRRGGSRGSAPRQRECAAAGPPAGPRDDRPATGGTPPAGSPDPQSGTGSAPARPLTEPSMVGWERPARRTGDRLDPATSSRKARAHRGALRRRWRSQGSPAVARGLVGLGSPEQTPLPR